MRDQTASVEITGIAAGGAGVGRLPDGRVVFVHRTAPGDLADVTITRERRRHAEATLRRLRSPGPARREPPCPHYARCGGCTIEHMQYAAQLEAKREIVANALRRIGGVAVTVPAVRASPNEFRYRNRVSFTLVRLAGGRVVAGFHELGRPDRVLDVDGRCLLPEPALAEAWAGLREGWGDGAARLPGGPTLRLTLRASAEGEAALLVEGGTGAGQPDALLERVPRLRSIWQRGDLRAPPVLLAGDDRLRETWAGETIGLGGTTFVQVNREAARLLEAHVDALAGTVAGRRVIDAFCGIGVHARRLARRGARVHGIELDPAAVAAAREASGGLDITIEEGRVEERIGAALPADLVVLNPPRSGLHERAAEALRAAPADRLLYVSCDPATLARDVGRLEPVYALRSLHCFDLFPQTAHVETVAELTCATT